MKAIPDVKLYGVFQDGNSTEAVELDAGLFIFPGGEPHTNGLLNDENFDRFMNADKKEFLIRIYGGSFEAIGTALVLEEYLTQFYQGIGVNLALPYFPGARQDKPAAPPMTGKVYAEVLKSSYFRQIFVVDLHSSFYRNAVFEGSRVVEIPAHELVPEELFHYQTSPAEGLKTFAIIAPDEGAFGRAKSIADKYRLPLVRAVKKRDANNNFRVGEYAFLDTFEYDFGVVIDDICDGGGTFLALADALNVDYTRLRLWTTHGIYSKGLENLYDRYGVIATTDSIRHPNTMIDVPLLPAILKNFVW